MLHHGQTLKTLCKVKEASYKKSYDTVTCLVSKSTETERLVVARAGRDRRMGYGLVYNDQSLYKFGDKRQILGDINPIYNESPL